MYVGDDALEYALSCEQAGQHVSLSHPISRGQVSSWADVEAAWAFCFARLGVDPAHNCVILTEPSLSSKFSRERSAQVLFEQFDVPAMYSCVQGQLALFAAGEVTGTVVESGHGVTHVVPVVDGSVRHEGIQRLGFGGADATAHVQRALERAGVALGGPFGPALADLVKRSLGALALADYEHERAAASREVMTLPDGRTVSLGPERFDCGEMLFAPGAVGIEAMGAADAVHVAVAACERKYRDALLATVVLSGGNTLYAGVTRRMRAELKRTASPNAVIAVSQPAAPTSAVWLGARIVASTAVFQKMAVLKASYAEYGPNFIHRRC